MENEKEFLEFVGTASEQAGAFAGKVATIGSKIAVFASGGISAGKEMLGLADEKTKGTPEKKSDIIKPAKLNQDIAVIRQKLVNAEKTQSRLESQLKELKTRNQSLVSELNQARSKLNEANKTQSQFELKLKNMQAEKESLLSELAIARKETGEITIRENTLTEQVAALESKFAVLQRELAETQSQAEKTQSELASQLKDSHVEKDSLISDLEKARNQSNEITSREEQVNMQAAKLESELAATRQELADMQSQAEEVQTQLNKQLRDLQAENESLVFKLSDARKEADDERMRADSMEAQIALLESGVAAFGTGLGKTHEEAPDTDVAPVQTVPESSNEDHAEIAVVPTVEEIKPSIEVTAQEEPIGTNVENVEEPKPEPVLEYEAEVDTEAIEPEPMPEVKATEPLAVTAKEVQAADFKNEADKILFTKAFSDFTSREAASRADAAGVIAGIHHELSLRLLITHMVNEPSALVRRECVKALATLEMKEGIGAVERALADEVASVRLAAVWGLYRLAGTESIPALTPMLSDNDEGVRRRAITCIGWVGGQIANAGNHPCQKVISALIQCLNDPAESIKNAALDALQAVTGKKICEAVPEGQISHQFLIDQWRSWWKEELICS